MVSIRRPFNYLMIVFKQKVLMSHYTFSSKRQEESHVILWRFKIPVENQWDNWFLKCPFMTFKLFCGISPDENPADDSSL